MSGSGQFAKFGGSDDTRPGSAVLAGGTVLLVTIAALTGADVAGDWRAGTGLTHLAIELTVVAVSTAGVVALWAMWLRGRGRVVGLEADLQKARAEADRWRGEAQEHLAGVSAAIDRQFERWGYTPAERDIALLLLKGLSLKDIADLRGTSERTVRQQSLAIYRKGGLEGRADLAAFFLEDLLAAPDRTSR